MGHRNLCPIQLYRNTKDIDQNCINKAWPYEPLIGANVEPKRYQIVPKRIQQTAPRLTNTYFKGPGTHSKYLGVAQCTYSKDLRIINGCPEGTHDNDERKWPWRSNFEKQCLALWFKSLKYLRPPSTIHQHGRLQSHKTQKTQGPIATHRINLRSQTLGIHACSGPTYCTKFISRSQYSGAAWFQGPFAA